MRKGGRKDRLANGCTDMQKVRGDFATMLKHMKSECLLRNLLRRAVTLTSCINLLRRAVTLTPCINLLLLVVTLTSCINLFVQFWLALLRHAAVDLHTAWVESLNTDEECQKEKNLDPVKNKSLYHCMIFFPLVAIC